MFLFFETKNMEPGESASKSTLVYFAAPRDAHTRTVVLAPYFRTFRTEYKEYGVRRPSYLESTDFSTGYGHFF